MAKVTVEIGAKTSGMKAGLSQSLNELRTWRQKAEAQIKGLQTQIASMKAKTEKAGGIGGFIAANKGIIGITAIAAAVRSLSNEVDELQDTSDATGVSMNSLSKLGLIFGQGGVEATELRKVLTNIGTAMGEVAGGSEDAAKKFAALGISADFVKENVGDTEKVLESVTKAMANQGSVQEAMAKGSPLLGSKNTRFAAVAVQMGRDYKGAMDEVKGAMTEEEARKIAQNMDLISVEMQKFQNGTVNVLGGLIKGLEEAGSAFGMLTSGGSMSPEILDDILAAEKAKGQASEADKKAQLETEAAAKRNLENDQKLKDAAAERLRTIQELQDEQEQLYNDQRDSAIEGLSLEEKQNYWLMKRSEALEEQKDFKDDTLKYEQASLNIAKAQKNLDDLKASQIAKISAKMGMTPQERSEAGKAERKKERDDKRAASLWESKQRDAIDNQVRKGEITKDEATSMKDALSVNKEKASLTMEGKILDDIRTHMATLASAIDNLKVK